MIVVMRYSSLLKHRHPYVVFDTFNDTYTWIPISTKVSDLLQKEKACRDKTTEMGGQPTSAFSGLLPLHGGEQYRTRRRPRTLRPATCL